MSRPCPSLTHGGENDSAWLPSNRTKLACVRLGDDLTGFYRPLSAAAEIDFDCYASDFKTGELGDIFARPEFHPMREIASSAMTGLL